MKFLVLSTLFLFPALAFAQERTVDIPTTNRRLEVVVFPQPPAQISDARSFDLPSGNVRLRWPGAPSANGIVPSSLRLDSSPPLRVRASDWQTATNKRLSLADFVGQTVSLLRPTGNGEKLVSGRLLGLEPVLLETSEGVLLNPAGTWVLPSGKREAERGNEQNALVWNVESSGGSHQANLRAQLSGLTWSAFYTATLEGDNFQLNGWAALNNTGGHAEALRGGEFLLRGNGEIRLPNFQLEPGTQNIAFVSANLQGRNRLNFSTSGKGGGGMARTFDFLPSQRLVSIDKDQNESLKRPLPVGPLTLWWLDAAPENRVRKFESWNPAVTDNVLFVDLGDDASRRVARRVITNKLLNPTTREWQIRLDITKGPDLTLVEGFDGDPETVKASIPPAVNDKNALRWEIPASEDDVILTYSVQSPA